MLGWLVVLAALDARPLLGAAGQLELAVVDRQSRKPIPCRLHLYNASGKPRTVPGVPFWQDHVAMPGKLVLKLPVGEYTFEIERGPEYVSRGGHFRIDNFADDTKEVDLGRFVDMSALGWWSGDNDVRRPVRDIELLMLADDLHLAQVITWSSDRSEGSRQSPPKDPVVRFDGNRYYHVMAGAHARAGTEVLYFGLPGPLKPVEAGGEYPPLVKSTLQAHEQPGAWVELTRPYWWDLPMLVAAGQVDSIEVAHGNLGRTVAICDEANGKARDRQRYPAPLGNAQWSHDIYFKLLDCGLRIPPSAGSGSGIVPNPVGMNRAYVHIDGEMGYAQWFEGLRAGRVVVTNGPLLLPTVEGELPGHVFQAEKGQEVELEIGLTLHTQQPISYLEIIQDGRVERSIRFADYAASGRLPKVKFQQSGWFLLRAVSDLPKTYRFAMTGPYYVEIGYQRRISKSAAQFFLDWVYERARQIQLADPAQRREVLEYHRKARDYWQQVVDRANAE